MINLDLNGLGVQEMNAEEMLSIEGGRWYDDFRDGMGVILLVLLIIACI